MNEISGPDVAPHFEARFRSQAPAKFSRLLADAYCSGMGFHRSTRGDERGSAFIEFLLLFPMLFFLFIGAFDMGFLSYALIGTQNAARIAALYVSSPGANTANACLYVR